MADFLKFIERNANNGVVYHREGIRGDYDLESEERAQTAEDRQIG